MKLSLLLVALLARLAHADEPKYACKERPADAKMTAELKPDVSLADLAVWVAGFTCKTVMFESGVAQHATTIKIIAPKPMTPKQSVQLFVDAVEATGLVVVQKNDSIIIKRNPKLPQGCPDVITTGPTTTPPATTPPAEADREADALAAAIDVGIIVVDDTHRTVKRDLLDKVLANPMAVAKGARVVPAVKDGKAVGFKLYAIRPSSIYAKLGLMNGDTLTAVNGFDLTTADKALEVYTKLREATSIEIDITRRGKPLKLSYTVK